MSETIQYIPIVKSKKNDLAALSDMRAERKRAVRPLIELAEYHAADIDAVLEQCADRVAGFRWPHAPFVDLYSLLPDAETSQGENATIAGFQQLIANGARFIPAYGRSRNDALWPALGAVARRAGSGFCFRVDVDDLDDQAEDTWLEIVERSAEMGIEPSNLHVVADLRYVGDRKPTRLVELVIDFVARRPARFAPADIAVVGSSALPEVSSVPGNGESAIARREWHTWGHVLNELAATVDVTFGDYGVVHPDFSQSGPSPNANGKIRYTRGDSIHYFRGSLLRRPPGYEQYHDLAARVVDSPVYFGPAFSAGDDRIWQCAHRLCGTGNLSTWVRADQNHHFEFVTGQVARLRHQIVRASTAEVSALLSGT